MLTNLVSVLLGYLIGSILPAYFLARWLGGLDIREVGTCHAGTTNIKRCLGLLPAIPTAIYDTLKGVAAIAIAIYGLNTSELVAYLSGLAAIAGHVFPFYIGFRGGRGAATATGILLFNLYKILPASGNLAFFAQDVGIILFVIITVLLISRKEDLLSVMVLPLLSYFLVLRFPFNLELIFTLIVIAYLLLISLSNIMKFRLVKIDARLYPDFRLWRMLMRPAAMAFPALSFRLSKTSLVTLLGSVLAVFFAIDLARLSHAGINRLLLKNIRRMKAVFKEKEEARVSSMTLFLLGCFLSFLLFERKIAVASVTFLIFGDMAAKVFGLGYGKHRLFSKTLEGTLAHLMACIVAGYILYLHIDIPLIVALLGGITASLVEVLPFGVDDNLTVSVISGAVMVIVLYFF